MNLQQSSVSASDSSRGLSERRDLLVREEEHLQCNLDGNNGEKDFKPSHDLERPIKAFDFALMFFDELGGEDVCPKLCGSEESVQSQ